MEQLEYVLEEKDNKFYLYVALPDVAADEINLTVGKSLITLSLDTESKFIESNSYNMPLPFDVDSTSNAILEYGVLSITLDKVVKTIKIEEK